MLFHTVLFLLSGYILTEDRKPVTDEEVCPIMVKVANNTIYVSAERKYELHSCNSSMQTLLQALM